MIDYATMAIFKKQNGELESEMLYDSTEGGEMINTLLHYDTIYTVLNSQHTFYLAQGFGQGSTALPWQEIKAFGISSNRLINPTIFPDNTFNIRIEFDTHEFNNQQRIPVIKVLENAHKIRVPEPTHKGGFSGAYQTFILNGNNYTLQ